MRISKSGNIRKQELLDSALELFYLNGFERTSIQDILDKVKISKGTFYYYFKSKDELLDAIAFQLADRILSMMKSIIDDSSLNSLEKLNLIIAKAQKIKAENIDNLIKIAKMLYVEENIKLRSRITDKTVELAKPLLVQLFQKGNEEAVFDISFPDETAEIYIRIGELFWTMILKLFDQLPESLEQIKQKIVFFNELIERMLGVEKNSINITNRVINTLQQSNLFQKSKEEK